MNNIPYNVAKNGRKRGKKKGKEKGGEENKTRKTYQRIYLNLYNHNLFMFYTKCFYAYNFFFFILTFDSITKIFFIYFIRSKDKTKKRYQITNASSLSKKINSFIYINNNNKQTNKQTNTGFTYARRHKRYENT